MTSENKYIYEMTLGRSSIGSICGAATVVLSILGLVHVLPSVLVAIATIVLGGSLLFRGAVISAEYTKVLSHLSGTTADKLELGGGMSVEILTGGAAIVLGILALLGLDPNTFVAIALIAAGSGVVMGCGIISRLNSIKLEVAGASGSTAHHKMAEEIVSTAMGTQILAGLVGIILGILALIGLAPITLNLVGLLILGAATLLTSSAISGKLLSIKHFG